MPKPYDPSTPDVTREGVVVRPGQVWEDLDKRMKGRRVTVVDIKGGKAIVRDSIGRTTRLSISRMHSHSTGFKLVSSKED